MFPHRYRPKGPLNKFGLVQQRFAWCLSRESLVEDLLWPSGNWWSSSADGVNCLSDYHTPHWYPLIPVTIAVLWNSQYEQLRFIIVLIIILIIVWIVGLILLLIIASIRMRLFSPNFGVLTFESKVGFGLAQCTPFESTCEEFESF